MSCPNPTEVTDCLDCGSMAECSTDTCPSCGSENVESTWMCPSCGDKFEDFDEAADCPCQKE